MADGRGRNEGAVDVSYKPPVGFKKLTSADDESVESGFEWDNINDNPDLDIWAVRVPVGLKASDLVGLKIKLPSSSTDDVSGKLKKDGINFVLHTVGGSDTLGVGEEMQNMRCLIPKSDEGGALYTAPKPLKHLVLTQQEPIPTPSTAPVHPAQPSRRPQPVDRLKHSFAPIGAPPLSPKSSSPKPMEIDESPKKKRKKQTTTEEIEAETPKAKSKAKAKAVAADEIMVIDDDTPTTLTVSKKTKKKSVATTDVQTQDVEASVKKEKKKRKAASED